MVSRRQYKNPPIEEALCEFQFVAGEDWDLTIPGKLHAELGDYTGKPRQRNVMEFGVETVGDRPPSLHYGEGLGRVQLLTGQGTRIVGVGPDVLSVHMLKPYQDPLIHSQLNGWVEFRHRIEEALEAYWKVASPKGVQRIGVRYINKITLPTRTPVVEDYLRCALPTISGLPNERKGFLGTTEYVYDDGVLLNLIVARGATGIADDLSVSSEVFLDLDVIWASESEILQSDALNKVEILRDREREAFEAVITDRSRKLFDA